MQLQILLCYPVLSNKSQDLFEFMVSAVSIHGYLSPCYGTVLRKKNMAERM
jgi:hypothetical protein